MLAGHQRASHQVQRHFSAVGCNLLWFKDATCASICDMVPVSCMVTGVFRQRIVGGARSTRMFIGRILRAREMVLPRYRPDD